MKTGEILIEAARRMSTAGEHLLAALLVAVWAAHTAREEGDEQGRQIALASALQALAAERGYEFNRHLTTAQLQDRKPSDIAAVFLTQNGEVVFAPPGAVIEKGYSPGLGNIVELGTPDQRYVTLAWNVDEPNCLISAMLADLSRQAKSGVAFAVLDVAKLAQASQEVEV